MSWLWTEKDEQRAVAEGWTYRNGYVRQTWEANPRFHSPWLVVEHLRREGRRSKWHREVYLALPWTEADETMSKHDGWRLTTDSIVRTSTRFASNEHAQEHVTKQATAMSPDPLCIKALACLAKRRLLKGVSF